MFEYILNNDTLIAFIDHSYTPYTFRKENCSFWTELLDAVKRKDADTIKNLSTQSKKEKLSEEFKNTNLYISGNSIKLKSNPHKIDPETDKILNNCLVDRILKMKEKNHNVTYMILFLDNLLQNVSNRAIEGLYEFLNHCNLPITNDGRFIAYKRIRYDYMDIHSGTINNQVGAIVSMPRNEVDDNPVNPCSNGLHVCSLEYLKQYPGDRLIVVLVNPKDVVCIPIDCNCTKMRVCKYEVFLELNNTSEEEFDDTLPAVFNTD